MSNTTLTTYKSIEAFEALLRQHINKSAVDQALQDYLNWSTHLKKGKKEIVHLLYLLKAAEQRSGNKTLKHTRQISEIILDKAEIPNLDRRKLEERSYLSLLKKEIDDQYQIELEFSDKKGSKIKKVVADPYL
jgi:hypothetical protein